MTNRPNTVWLQCTSCVDWPGSAGCYPLTAVTMRVAVVRELVVSVLAWGLVGRQGLRAGCVDSASHEHLLEVTLSVLQRVEKNRPQGILPVRGLSCPDASQLLSGKAIGSAHCYLNPSFPLNLSSSQPRSLSLQPSSLSHAERIIRFHIYTQQNHPQRNHSLSLMLHYANARSVLSVEGH